MLSGQLVATVMTQKLQELSELSQLKVFTNKMGHPVVGSRQAEFEMRHSAKIPRPVARVLNRNEGS